MQEKKEKKGKKKLNVNNAWDWFSNGYKVIKNRLFSLSEYVMQTASPFHEPSCTTFFIYISGFKFSTLWLRCNFYNKFMDKTFVKI